MPCIFERWKDSSPLQSFLSVDEMSRDSGQFCEDWAKLNAIDGWLSRNSAALLDSVLEAQATLGIPTTGVAEVGVWQGRSAVLMLRHAAADEKVLLLDSWLQVDAIRRSLDATRDLYSPKAAIVVVQDTSMRLIREVDPRVGLRLIHIDGDHTAAGLRQDLLVSRQVLSAHGIIVLDDIFNFVYPQLTKELFTFLDSEGRDLACFLLGFNKAYLCKKRVAEYYGEWIYQNLVDSLERREVPSTLCRTTDKSEWVGFSVVDFEGRMRRGPDYALDHLRP